MQDVQHLEAFFSHDRTQRGQVRGERQGGQIEGKSIDLTLILNSKSSCKLFFETLLLVPLIFRRLLLIHTNIHAIAI